MVQEKLAPYLSVENGGAWLLIEACWADPHLLPVQEASEAEPMSSEMVCAKA